MRPRTPKTVQARRLDGLVYNTAHRAERARLAPVVATGTVPCGRPDCLEVRDGRSRLIAAGSPWDLGHDRGTGLWRGPEHRRCNRSEGSAFANRKRSRQRSGTDGSSRW